MEASSPLAAMQPQPVPFGRHHWDHSSMDARLSTVFGSSNNFNFNDLSMGSKHSDFFDKRPSRVASPTVTLAVDLSRNFHIDKSPQPPTPRRSLFSGMGCGLEALTPPSLSAASSPVDSMDLSPLPHKQPQCTTMDVQVVSQEETSSDLLESMLSSPAIIPESPLAPLKAPSAYERRKPTLSRPALSRMKGLTTSMLGTPRSAGFNAPPPFKFGNLPFLHTVPSSSLNETFVQSPDETSFPALSQSPRPRSSYQKTNLSQQIPNNGSPVASSIKKPSAPSIRPRKQFRRSLSMFEHPIDVLNQQKHEQQAECAALSSIMDIDEAPQLQLPHFFQDDDTIPRINKATMIDILDGKFGSCYDKSMVIDCRFEYEYKGGHIEGAINFNDKEELATRLFDQHVTQKTLLIFHCEYSAHRAPIAAKYIRGEDRATNAHQYPKLTYPEVYILDGGYSSFFKDHKQRCFPQHYVEMNDKQHTTACERGLGKVKQQRAKLSRAATFAFGSCSQMHESPTAPARTATFDKLVAMDLSMDLSMDVSIDESPILRRGVGRRMASF